MVYDLIKKEKINDHNDPFSGKDKFYYNLVYLIEKYAQYNNIDYVITGTIAFAIFFEKTYKTAKDLDMHINPEDIEKWISFFKKILPKNFKTTFYDQKYKPQSRNISIEGVDEEGEQRTVECFSLESPKILRQNQDVERCRGLNLSIKNNCRTKTVYLRPKDYDDMYYYNLSLYYFFYHQFCNFLIPTLFIDKRFPLKLMNLILKDEKSKI